MWKREIKEQKRFCVNMYNYKHCKSEIKVASANCVGYISFLI